MRARKGAITHPTITHPAITMPDCQDLWMNLDASDRMMCHVVQHTDSETVDTPGEGVVIDCCERLNTLSRTAVR
jgi:hypothetical protein